jgi:hypothetical protein
MAWRIIPLAALLCLALAAPAAAQEGNEQVDQAVRRGVAFLWGLQGEDGNFTDPQTHNRYLGIDYNGAATVMSMVALAYAGEDLRQEPMKKGLRALAALDLPKTYTLGFRIIALAELYRRADRETKELLRGWLKRDVVRLAEMQFANGAWSYEKVTGLGNDDFDFSNTQLAVLALREADLCGLELNRDIFLKVQKLYLEKQRADGGWDYARANSKQTGQSYGSMTAAAVASLFITREALEGSSGCPCRNGRSSGLRNARVEAAIARGIKWLDGQFTTTENPACPTFVREYVHYWLYACERVGIASGFKYLGRHNWYAEGAKAIIAKQGANGSWGSSDETSLALLFLIKGRAPILLNKLHFDGAWDMHPHDAANLAKYVGQVKEQPMNWQVINLEAPVEEWHDAPLLYISAESVIKLTDEHKKKLRQFTDTGGTILFEASCGNQTVASWWRSACQDIWPEWELKLVDKDHPLWTADLNMTGRRPPLWGLFDGLRTVIFFSTSDLSCPWSTSAVTKEQVLFQLGCNLYAYTTDRGRLRAKLAARRSEERQEHSAIALAPGQRSALRLRLLKHGGDYYISRHYRPLEALAAYLKERGRLAVELGDAITAGDEDALKTDVFWLTGRKALMLSAEETAALRKWLAAGGYLVVEAAMGDAEFDKSFEAAAKELGLDVRPAGRETPLTTGALAGATGFKLDPVDFTYALRAERLGQPYAELRELRLGGRLVGVYSPFDVSLGISGIKAFGSRGYAAVDAPAVATNMLLPASTLATAPPTGTTQPAPQSQ